MLNIGLAFFSVAVALPAEFGKIAGVVGKFDFYLENYRVPALIRHIARSRKKRLLKGQLSLSIKPT